jgi:hypothetical protein
VARPDPFNLVVIKARFEHAFVILPDISVWTCRIDGESATCVQRGYSSRVLLIEAFRICCAKLINLLFEISRGKKHKTYGIRMMMSLPRFPPSQPYQSMVEAWTVAQPTGPDNLGRPFAIDGGKALTGQPAFDRKYLGHISGIGQLPFSRIGVCRVQILGELRSKN